MATVDELVVQIRADTKDLRNKLGQTNKQLEKTGKEAKKAGKGLGNAFSGGKIAIIAATGVLVKFVSTISKVGMEFEDLKDSLDVVFGSMAAGDAAMSRVLQFAQTTPFQVETVTKAFIALQSVGIEPTSRMLQTFADTASVSVDQLGVFEALVRTVQRSAAGGLGLEELNMLSDRGIPALKILQEELGLAKDDIAKFGKTAQGAKIITDALQAGLEKRFGGAMETKMDNLSTKTSNMTIAFKQLGDEIFAGGLGDDLKTLTDRLTGFATAAAKAMQVRRGDAIDITDRRENKFAGFTSKSGRARFLVEENVIIEEQLQKLRDRENFLTKKNVELVGLEEGFEEGSLGLEGLIDARKRNVKEMDLIHLRRKDLEEFQKQINKRDVEIDKESILIAGQKLDMQNKLVALFKKSRDPLEDVKNQIDLGKESLREFFDAAVEAKTITDKISFDEFVAGIQDVIDDDKISELEKAFGELAPVIAEATNKFTNDFVQSLMDGENAMESFKNLFKDMARQIIASALQMQIIKPIMDAMFTAVGLPVLDESAGGGRVQKGQPTLVGERGAEIFIPNTGGTVLNNMNSKNALSGGGDITVVQHNNFALGVGATARAEVAKLLPQIQESSKAAVLEAAARGGSFRRGLMGG